MTIPPMQRPPAPLPQPPRLELPHAMFSALAIASSGLSAQRVRMDVVAQNLANAETTKTPEGGPYHRRTVTLEPVLPQSLSTASMIIPNTPIAGMPAPSLAPSAFASTPLECASPRSARTRPRGRWSTTPAARTLTRMAT